MKVQITGQQNMFVLQKKGTLSMWGTSLTDFKVTRNADITSSQQRKNVI